MNDPLNARRAAGYEITLVPEIPRIIDDDNIMMAPGPRKIPVSILNDNHFEELVFPYLFPTGKFGYKVKHKVPLSLVKYFNQQLLNFWQSFVLDADYIFLRDQLLSNII